MKHLFKLLLLTLPNMAVAQNPIIHDQFTADPTARVFDGKVYLYTSHDIVPPEGARKDWFCMEDYHIFSSSDLTAWHDHGVFTTQNDIPWVNNKSFSMWAPDCVEKGGKYYFYFPAVPREGRGFRIGVGVSDNPAGPFLFEDKPIEGIMGIDPCVLNDDDGQSYIYWGGVSGAPLAADMKSLASNPTHMEGLPQGFKEGPFVFKRNGHYYLTFPWVRNEGGTETLAYAMSDKPLGPWEFKGVFMKESSTGCWTNHHSIVCYQDEWYLFYHHNDYSPHDDKRRAVRIDRIKFNPDGTLCEVIPTLRGVGVTPSTTRIDIDRYSETHEKTIITHNDTTDTFRGWHVTLPETKSWLTYHNVDFSMLASNAYITANVKASENTVFTIRDGGPKGKVIARIPVTVKGGEGRRRDYSDQWFTVTAPIQHIPEGICHLYIYNEGATVSIDWIQFKNPEKYFSPASKESSTPDGEGFIRRWTLLEPINKPNPTNTVFTDSYLRQHFYMEYFPNQLNIEPCDGQKVKVAGQRLTWHTLDSERYNVKLFRFADALNKQLYGVLFWAFTTIDCPEEITDVRLSVGSNSASIWWINGEEALLLSGDRRMVRDDAVSPRLTLKKGRNIIRGAIINGPGMSDFCLRFLDKNGEPITNITIK